MHRDSSSRPRRILIVEDDAGLVDFLAELLSEHGYEVIRAQNGVDALVALTAPTSELPDVVLLDLGLPLESGISVLGFIRDVVRSRLPVIVLTGSTDPDEEQAVRKLGVCAYLTKPASSEQILSAVARVLA